MDERLGIYLRSIADRLAALGDELRERYGWTHMDVTLRVELEPESLRPLLVLSGEIAVPSLAGPIRAAVVPMLLDGVQLDLRLQPLAVREWYVVPAGGIELWSDHHSRSKRALATELEPADGPVGHLAHDGPGMLLRARDGTVGWASGLLGHASAARPITEVSITDEPGLAICKAARAYLGTPYVLGGATKRRIDCSALVARAYERSVGLLLPRHSHDQLAVGGGGQVCGAADGSPGDLMFIHSRRMQRLHVGIVSEAGTIIHASRSRSAVIEEPAVEFQLDAEWLRRVSLTQLLEWSRTQIGRPHLELPIR
jgi:NlpC/P60 family